MTTSIEYALMSGASYISTRDRINQFPTPDGWTLTRHANPENGSGFEAVTFTNGTEIVISYAGTGPGVADWIHGNVPLAMGVLSDQLQQAADYYLAVKAINPRAEITITGHSLGGGLASLIAVMFGERAFTFDQAPFLKSAQFFVDTDFEGNQTVRSVAQGLRSYLAGHATAAQLAKLDAYIAANNPDNLAPVAGDTLAGRETAVTNYNVQGEVLIEPIGVSNI